MSRIVMLVLVLIGPATLAACGGGTGSEALSKEEYEQTVADAGDTLGQAFENLSTRASEISGENLSSGEDFEGLLDELASVVGDAAGTVSDAADELEGLEPPEDAVEANEQLATGLQALADDLEELEAAVAAGDLANVFDLSAGLQEIATSDAGTQIQSAIDELTSLGYEVQGES
jgi:hypothetical protein